MEAEDGTFEELMAWQGYRRGCFFHFDKLHAILMDWTVVEFVPHRYHGVDTSGFQFVTAHLA